MKRYRIHIVLLGLLLVAIYSYRKASAIITSKGFNSLSEFVSITFSNYSLGESPELNLSIAIKPKHFAKLEQIRNEALKRGVIIQPEDPYVPCVIEVNGKKIKGEIRLKGKMTDHVSGKKWSFRVKTKKGDGVYGMKRFTLQHPGTRGYVYEWIYHELCKLENIVSLRYYFINLTLNGDALGVYALEENFAQELVQNNKRPKGPVFRFNPTLYWQDRLHVMNKVYVAQEYTTFQNSFVEVFSKKESFTDPELKSAFVKANSLINAYRWGKIPISEVFDVKKLAIRYAILDLFGGYHSVDWSDLKFYYNPIEKIIEPVAYESFGNRFIDQIIGNYRFTEGEGFKNDFHDLIFNDPVFFKAYVKALEDISADGYLENFLASIKIELDKNIAIQYSEFPYKNYSPEVFYFNRKMIRETLNTPKGIHVYLQEISGDSMSFKVQVIESLPMELLSISSKEDTFLIEHESVLPGLAKNSYPKFYLFKLGLPKRTTIDSKRGRGLKVQYRILGSSSILDAEVFPYPLNDISDSLTTPISTVDLSTLNFLTLDSVNREIRFKQGEISINYTLVFPKDWEVFGTAPLTINMSDNASMEFNGKTEFKGSEEREILFNCNTTAKYALKFNVENEENILSWVQFNSVLPSNQVLLYKSKLKAINTTWINSKNSISLYNSNLSISNSIFTGIKKSAIKTFYSEVSLKYCDFIKCNRGVNSIGSNLKLNALNIDVGAEGLVFKDKSVAILIDIELKNLELGIKVKNGSSLTLNNSFVSKCKLGIRVYDKGNLFGSSNAVIENVKINEVDVQVEVKEGCGVKIDGEIIKPS